MSHERGEEGAEEHAGQETGRHGEPRVRWKIPLTWCQALITVWRNFSHRLLSDFPLTDGTPTDAGASVGPETTSAWLPTRVAGGGFGLPNHDSRNGRDSP